MSIKIIPIHLFMATSKKTSIGQSYLLGALSREAEAAQHELDKSLRKQDIKKRKVIPVFRGLIGDIRKKIEKAGTQIDSQEQLDSLCALVAEDFEKAARAFSSESAMREVGILRGHLRSVKRAIAEEFELPSAGRTAGVAPGETEPPPPEDEPDDLDAELAALGTTREGICENLVLRLNGFIILIAKDFFKRIGNEQEFGFKNKLTLSQVIALKDLFKELRKCLKSALRELNKPTMTYDEIRAAIYEAVDNCEFGSPHLPRRIPEIFKGLVLDILKSFAGEARSLTELCSLSEPAEASMGNSDILSQIIPDKVAIVELMSESEGEEIDYPFTSEENALMLEWKARYAEIHAEEYENIARVLNSEFHGGLNLRSGEDIALKLQEATTATRPVESVGEPISVDFATPAAVSPVDQGTAELTSQSVDQPAPAAPTQMETPIVVEPSDEHEKPQTNIVEPSAPSLFAQLSDTVESYRTTLERLQYFHELLRMREGLITEVKRSYEMRNPPIESIRADILRLTAILEDLNPLKDEAFVLLSDISPKKVSIRTTISQVKREMSAEVIDELRQHLNLIDEFERTYNRMAAIIEEVKDIAVRRDDLIGKVQKGDAYFSRRIREHTLGADPRIILGYENAVYFEKNSAVDVALNELDILVKRCLKILEEIDDKKRTSMLEDTRELIQEAISPFIEDSPPSPEAVTAHSDEEQPDSREDLVPISAPVPAPVPSSQSPTIASPAPTAFPLPVERTVGIDIGDETMSLTPSQIRVVSVLTEWGAWDKVWGRKIDDLMDVLEVIFPSGQPVDKESPRFIEQKRYLTAQMDTIAESVTEPSKRPPNNDARKNCQKALIRWKHIGRRVWYLPTQKAYKIAERLPVGFQLDEPQRAKVKALKDAAREETLRRRAEFVEKAKARNKTPDGK